MINPRMLGFKVGMLLLARDMGQKDLAAAAGVSIATINLVVAGKAAPGIAYTTLAAIADALEVPLGDLTSQEPLDNGLVYNTVFHQKQSQVKIKFDDYGGSICHDCTTRGCKDCDHHWERRVLNEGLSSSERGGIPPAVKRGIQIQRSH